MAAVECYRRARGARLLTLTKESLAEYVARVRDERRLTREEVSARAKRAGRLISNSYIRKIENAETLSPTIEKLDALAAGLGVTREDLIEKITQQPAARGESPAIGGFDGAKYPPTEEEFRIALEASQLGIKPLVLRTPGFWDLAPEKRRANFRNLENLIDEVRRTQREIADGF